MISERFRRVPTEPSLDVALAASFHAAGIDARRPVDQLTDDQLSRLMGATLAASDYLQARGGCPDLVARLCDDLDTIAAERSRREFTFTA